MYARNILKLSFILTTIALSSVVAYTLNYYYGVFLGVRGLQLSIQFEIDTSNPATVTLKALVSLQNPSGYSFRLREVHEELYLDNTYVLTAYRSPLPDISPQSTATISISEAIPESFAASVTEPGRTLSLYTRVSLIGPLVGTFQLTDFRQTSNSS